MTFLEQLQSHKGGLIRLKELYWYGSRGWDGSPDRICLVLDADAAHRAYLDLPEDAAKGTTSLRDTRRSDMDVALLLIDGRPQWICVSQEGVEFL